MTKAEWSTTYGRVHLLCLIFANSKSNKIFDTNQVQDDSRVKTVARLVRKALERVTTHIRNNGKTWREKLKVRKIDIQMDGNTDEYIYIYIY